MGGSRKITIIYKSEILTDTYSMYIIPMMNLCTHVAR